MGLPLRRPEPGVKCSREATLRGQPIAKGKFDGEISEKIGRRLEARGPGRPRKDEK